MEQVDHQEGRMAQTVSLMQLVAMVAEAEVGRQHQVLLVLQEEYLYMLTREKDI